jgi:hypothetical protein
VLISTTTARHRDFRTRLSRCDRIVCRLMPDSDPDLKPEGIPI